jgi:hypothetical protein
MPTDARPPCGAFSAAQSLKISAFMMRLLDPEDLGHAVSAEVRREVLSLLWGDSARGEDRGQDGATSGVAF